MTRGMPAPSSGPSPHPAPEYNFAVEPVVTSLDDFWHRKYDEDEDGRAVRKEKADETSGRASSTPTVTPTTRYTYRRPPTSPSSSGLGIMIIFYGIMYHTRPWGIPLMRGGGTPSSPSVAALLAWGSEPLEEIHDEDHGGRRR